MDPQRYDFAGDQSVPFSMLVSVEEDSAVLELDLEFVPSLLVLVVEDFVLLEPVLGLVPSILVSLEEDSWSVGEFPASVVLGLKVFSFW